MSFENKKSQKDSPLNNENAQEEANMMRVLVEDLGHEPTSEDYDNALAAIENLREFADENESAFLDMLAIGNKYFQGGISTILKLITFNKFKESPKTREFHMHMFDSSKHRLERLKEKAKEPERSQD